MVGVAAVAAEPGTDVSRRLRGAISAGRSFEYVRELTQTFGARVTGSQAYERAADWAVDQFHAAGVPTAALEPFIIERGWQRGSVRARVTSAHGERFASLPLEPLGWTPSTPDGGVEGDVVVLREGNPSAIVPSEVRGRIVLLAQAGSAGAALSRLPRHRAFDAALRDAGALAVLVSDSSPGNVLTAQPRDYSTDIAPLPVAQVGRDDALALRRLASNGSVRVAFEYHNQITSGPVETHNVIAEITGRQRPDEWVVVGAHLDSWDFATGAQDNGTGVAMVIEAARAIASLENPPRRSIRFALWGGEEQGLQGSSAYVRAHARELDGCVAVLNTDGGTGRIRGWSAPGRADVAASFVPIARALLAPLGAAAIDTSTQYAFDSDHAPFLRAGIPALDLNPDDGPYEQIHHRAADTLERVDRDNLVTGASVVAITAYAVADSPNRLAPRRTPQPVR
jgi:Iap family predicted aminopeptidase